MNSARQRLFSHRFLITNAHFIALSLSVMILIQTVLFWFVLLDIESVLMCIFEVQPLKLLSVFFFTFDSPPSYPSPIPPLPPLQDVSRGSPSFWLCLTGVKLSPVHQWNFNRAVPLVSWAVGVPSPSITPPPSLWSLQGSLHIQISNC